MLNPFHGVCLMSVGTLICMVSVMRMISMFFMVPAMCTVWLHEICSLHGHDVCGVHGYCSLHVIGCRASAFCTVCAVCMGQCGFHCVCCMHGSCYLHSVMHDYYGLHVVFVVGWLV